MAEKSSAASTLIVGCGYIGLRVAQRLREENPESKVYTVTRWRPRAAELDKQGFSPIIADWTDRRTLAGLPQCQRVLVAVSYDGRSGKSREASQVGGLNNLLDNLPAQSDLIYLSTTGVYHQQDGSWVDEASPARPIGEGGQAHLRAEALLHRQRPRGNWLILRLSGIYGPGRILRLADIAAGRPIDGPCAGYLNLIHREDVVRAILAAWQLRQRSRRLYLIADDQPVIRRAFYERIAQLTHSPPPVFTATADASLSGRSQSNKRIWNRRMHRDLLPRLQYPSYIEGLTDLLG
jgi:nucleoside-diphosphate-sugar epimerase